MSIFHMPYGIIFVILVIEAFGISVKVYRRHRKKEYFRYHTDTGNADRVLEKMKEDYVSGKITLERFEVYVENRLNGKTPVDAEGWPLYYEPNLLDGTEQFAP